jgi:hypothetical protein
MRWLHGFGAKDPHFKHGCDKIGDTSLTNSHVPSVMLLLFSSVAKSVILRLNESLLQHDVGCQDSPMLTETNDMLHVTHDCQ